MTDADHEIGPAAVLELQASLTPGGVKADRRNYTLAGNGEPWS